jgi:hypothetical protein
VNWAAQRAVFTGVAELIILNSPPKVLQHARGLCNPKWTTPIYLCDVATSTQVRPHAQTPNTTFQIQGIRASEILPRLIVNSGAGNKAGRKPTKTCVDTNLDKHPQHATPSAAVPMLYMVPIWHQLNEALSNNAGNPGGPLIWIWAPPTVRSTQTALECRSAYHHNVNRSSRPPPSVCDRRSDTSSNHHEQPSAAYPLANNNSTVERSDLTNSGFS